jgi:hypothetical protein
MSTEVFHPVAGTVEVVLFAQRSGQERRNVIHYQYGGTRPTVAELTNLANDMAADVIGAQKNLVCAGTDWYQVTCRDIHDQFGNMVAIPVSGQGGTGGTNVLPGDSSVCMSKRSGLPGRSFRGRFYLFDIDESYSNGDDLNPLINIFMTDLASKLLTVRQAGRFTPAIASKLRGQSTKMTSMTWDQVMDTQVRRGKGRGQ